MISEMSDSHLYAHGDHGYSSFVDVLPWEDVIFRQIFPCFSIREVFYLRGINKVFLDCVTLYFETTNKIDLGRVASKCNAKAFEILSRHNSSLTILNLCNAKDWLEDPLLIPVVTVCNKLEKLDIAYCTSVTNASIMVLTINCPQLKHLVLRECCWVTSASVTTVAMHCPKMHHLDLGGCWNVDDEAVTMLALMCRELSYLSVSKIYGLTDNSITALARNCHRLRHLNMQGCWRVTNDSVSMLAEYCKHLKALQVRECRDINELSLSKCREKNIKVDIPNYKRNFVLQGINKVKVQI